MQSFSLKLHFRTSRSPRFKEVLNWSVNFEDFCPGETNTIDISLKEMFEKWEWFNNIFLSVIDWKGTILEFNGMRWHSHADKKFIFYGLQSAHAGCRNIEYQIASQVDLVYKNKCLMWDLPIEFTERDYDGFLDLINFMESLNKPKTD